MLVSSLVYTLVSVASSISALTRSIEGTWASKSKAVMTGPGFFNPLTDSLLEPNHTGVSYSFTTDGHFESALYTITANPVKPQCPSGVLQWAHGTYTLAADGSILMVPIPVDGRQLVSAPCTSSDSQYIRFSGNETMQSYSIELDSYRGEWKLTLNRLYGAPVQPLYLVYDPPQMLPTTTLLPTAHSKAKRSLPNPEGSSGDPVPSLLNSLWYSGATMLFLGGLAFVCV